MDIVQPTDRVHPNEAHNGIDLRTWMATQFATALLTSGLQGSDIVAHDALVYADALIAELNKTAEVAHETT